MLDPLGCHEPLPLVRRFYPIGYALEIATNSEDVIAAAEENWGWFKPAFSSEPLRVRIAVSATPQAGRPDTPSFRAMGHLISIISDRANFAVCDLRDGFAFCRLTEKVAQDRTWMRQRFLDGMVLCMLVCREVTPIHASCVMKNGRGLLLCGRSGAGKSSMAFACASRGWTFVTDDVAYLRRGVADRVVLGTRAVSRVGEAPGDYGSSGRACSGVAHHGDHDVVPGANRGYCFPKQERRQRAESEDAFPPGRTQPVDGGDAKFWRGNLHPSQSLH
jgi:hypothetical protein